MCIRDSVRTDHAALKYLLTTPEPVGRQGRWLDLLSEYDITIQHRPGRVHGNCDALSRRPCERSSETDCQQCRRATPALAAAPISCEALPAESSNALPAHLHFLPLHSQADASTTFIYCTAIHRILPVQFMCMTVCPSLLWSTSWSGTVHFICHTFLHPTCVFFSQYMPIAMEAALL